MAAAKWADAQKDVQPRLGVAETAIGWTAADIEERLLRAENRIRDHLATYITNATMDAWTDKTVPDIVREWVANLAAAFILADFHGQVLGERRDGEKAGDLFLTVETDLKKLKRGELTIVDTAGDEVPAAEDRVESSTADRTPYHTLTHPKDGDWGEGSLDELV